MRPDKHPIATLHGDRVTLRPFTNADVPAVEALLDTPEIARTTLNVAYPYPKGAAEAWISTHPDQARAGIGFVWAIVLNEEVIGTISIGITRQHARGSLGYWLGVPFWNCGYTTEAARLVVDYGFTILGLHRIEAACLPHNIGSSRVMEKAGLTYEGTYRGYYRKGEDFVDVAIYAAITPI